MRFAAIVGRPGIAVTRVILASGSPRRRELLKALVPDFEVLASDVPEATTDDPIADAIRLASLKAEAVAALHPDAIVVGADTIVHDGVRAYGKPADPGDAIAMWKLLRGRMHRVVTGVAVVSHGRVAAAYSEAGVKLSNLTDAAVARYVDSGRPLDKAGAYAIQDDDVPTVMQFGGCYCCVVGLPLWRLRGLLESAGVVCASPTSAYERCEGCPERS
jgi:septum formation protein